MSDTAEILKSHDTSAEYQCTAIQHYTKHKIKTICFMSSVAIAIKHYVLIIVTLYYNNFFLRFG